MLKRTKGRLLLTLLVVTGLAGTVNDTSLNNHERKTAVNRFRQSKNELVQFVKSLSEKQLDFKLSADALSIREQLCRTLDVEKKLWSKLEAAIAQPARQSGNDDIPRVDDTELGKQGVAAGDWADHDHDAIETEKLLHEYKVLRNQQLRFARTTTHDLHNRLIELNTGWIDCYQLMIYQTMLSDITLQEMKHTASKPGFPRGDSRN